MVALLMTYIENGKDKKTVEWLLVYEVIDDVLVLMLYKVGSYFDLFR